MSKIGDLIVDICEEFEAGKSIRKIARHHKLSTSYVYQVLTDYYGDLIRES